MIAYRYDTEQKNKYAGEQPCQIDPIASLKSERDVFLLPGDCTYEKPLTAKEGFDIVFDIARNAWGYVEVEKEEEPAEQEPTLENKVNQLDSQYWQNKNTLQGYYVGFMIAGDIEGMESIKRELTALATQYDTDVEALKGGEE